MAGVVRPRSHQRVGVVRVGLQSERPRKSRRHVRAQSSELFAEGIDPRVTARLLQGWLLLRDGSWFTRHGVDQSGIGELSVRVARWWQPSLDRIVDLRTAGANVPVFFV